MATTNYGAYAGGALGLYQAYSNMNAAADAINAETEMKLAGIRGSKAAYAATTEALIFQQGVNEINANNAIVEIARAGAANKREVKVALREQEGKVLATTQSEGITAGNSQARQYRTFLNQSSKIMSKVDEDTRSQVIKVADTLEQSTIAIKLQEQQAYNNMLSAIAGYATSSSVQIPNLSDTLMTTLSGVQTGMSIQSSYKTLTSEN
jgi:hypothetical protein